jgi:sugar phosphate isomerase/epimerase
MASLNRRGFLASAAVSTVAAHAGALKTVGAQLYTLRGVLPQKPAETLRELDRIGYKEVEVTAAGLDGIWPSLKRTSLKPVSIHLDTALFTTSRDKLPAALDDARARGIEYAVCPYIAPQDRGGVDVIRKLADALNQAGRICAGFGMKLCYHNHAFEFAAAEGGTLLDVLMSSADPKLVGLELDIMWSTVAGVNPVSVIRKYQGRIALLHLKNVSAGIPVQYNENVPPAAFREVGDGVIDIPAVLKASASVGVAHYFVEQDQTPGDPLESLRRSYEYLSKLNF